MIRWQVASRIFGAYTIPFVGSTVLYVGRGMNGATGNIYYGLHEFDEMAFTLHFLRRDDVFVDVGSNVGVYTVLAAGGCGAQVYAFEPIRRSADSLRRNVNLNGLQRRVTVVEAVAGRGTGSVWMTRDLDTTNRVQEQPGSLGHSVRVPMRSLDDTVEGSVSLIKIDVEGHEDSVLLGARRILHNDVLRALIIERDGLRSVGKALLSEAGFDEYSYNPWNRTLTRGGNGINALFLRDARETEHRLRESSSFTIHAIGLEL